MVKNLGKILLLAGALITLPGNSMEENLFSSSEKNDYRKVAQAGTGKRKVKLYEGSENYKMVFNGYEIYGNPEGSIDSMYLEGKKVENLGGITLKYAEKSFNYNFNNFYDKERNQ